MFVDAFELPGQPALPLRRPSSPTRAATLDLFRGPDAGRAAGGLARRACRRVTAAAGRDALGARKCGTAPASAPRSPTPSSGPHEHFHFSSAARYALAAGGRGRARVSDKVGFCLFDSLRPTRRAASTTASRAPGRDVVRRSTTRTRRRCGWGSRRAAPTSTAPSASASGSTSPGCAGARDRVRAQANPLRCILESDAANNHDERSAADPRRAGGRAVASAAARRCVGSSGAVVAPEVPGAPQRRLHARARAASCYVWASAAGPLSVPGRRGAGARDGGAGAGRRRAARGGDLHAGGRLRGRGLASRTWPPTRAG